MRVARTRWTKRTTTTSRALVVKFIWSVLATSCSFSQASLFAKNLSEHSSSGFELRLQSTRWLRELVTLSRRCKMSQMPLEPPRLRSQASKAFHQSSRVSQITSTCEIVTKKPQQVFKVSKNQRGNSDQVVAGLAVHLLRLLHFVHHLIV